MPVRLRSLVAATAITLAAVLTGCSGGSDEPAGPSSDGHSHASEPGVSHIHGLGVNPGDGKLYVATHHGVIAVDDKGSSRRVSDTADYMGFTVVGPDTFLGSGHPPEGSDEPANRGLIKSTDAGKTWKTLSLGGEVDFHALEQVHDTIYGYDSTHGLLRVSRDGKKWDERAELAALDIAVSPENPDTVLATTQGGIARSTDGGETFAGGAEPVLAHLSWAGEDGKDVLYGIGPDGALHRSTDGGESWTETGTVPGGQPQALTAVTADRVLAATAGGVYESTDGGRTFTERLETSAGGH
ncbi:exo-alpha-sialidase [Streptomyces sp. TRM43335]|uniref:Exo-alpha-sialidase n=1 Tax=Streptomyces taklimakanensis TaxID=2569853 RepID=A0A6G2BIK3_9ACTN|nr:exo-alpha-sialidase [Streptomyces taklimakanensis]MTE22098.1 exo-alpha-sialidase [Streptomyces taklimakanensis]